MNVPMMIIATPILAAAECRNPAAVQTTPPITNTMRTALGMAPEKPLAPPASSSYAVALSNGRSWWKSMDSTDICRKNVP